LEVAIRLARDGFKSIVTNVFGPLTPVICCQSHRESETR